MKLKIIKNIICFLVLFLFTVTAVSAVTLTSPIPGVTSFDQVANNIITGILGISGVLALIAFVYGGVLWLASAGNQNYIEKGKQVMIWAVWGLLIIFASYAVIEFLFSILLSGSNTTGGGNTLQQTS